MDTTNITRTGTTCVGLKFKDGVILATDRRTTAGYVVSDKSVKVEKLADNVAATHSGTVSDAQLYRRVIKAEIRLRELNTERQITVREAATIANSLQYKNVRTPTTIQPVVGYLIGGYDDEGAQLFEVGPDGTLLEFDGFAADGSGSIFIKSFLDTEFKPNMNESEAAELVQKAIVAAMKIDNHSGGGIVMVSVTKDGIKDLGKKVLKTELVAQ